MALAQAFFEKYGPRSGIFAKINSILLNMKALVATMSNLCKIKLKSCTLTGLLMLKLT